MSQKVRNNKFIGAFVNEMYAILLGIGLGNVLFVQQIDLNLKSACLLRVSQRNTNLPAPACRFTCRRQVYVL
jgi:hypothetical protein